MASGRTARRRANKRSQQGNGVASGAAVRGSNVVDMFARAPDSGEVDLPREAYPETGENWAATRPNDTSEWMDRIRLRMESAYRATRLAAKENARGDRQRKGLYQDWEEYEDAPQGDDRIYLKKTLEHAQVIYGHLETLTSQLLPLVKCVPRPQQMYAAPKAYERAKLKEILVNNQLDLSRFETDTLPSWRWKFLFHTSAFIRVIYKTDAVDADIEFRVVDRANLYIDPNVDTGNIRDANWVIEEEWVTREEAQDMIDTGHWHLPGGVESINSAASQPNTGVLAELLGTWQQRGQNSAMEDDESIKVWHYWQAKRIGQEAIYGCALGGHQGHLVFYGPNPQPYKGIPYRGKSYLRDPNSVDGMSLANQHRHINEVANTFLDLRIQDVLENSKSRWHVAAALFDEKTEEDHLSNSKYVRFNTEYMEKLASQKLDPSKFIFPPNGSTSTDNLLQDMKFLEAEGRSETNVSDVFRGGNPQSGATMGQYQEQIMRSLQSFRPVYKGEMTLLEEIAEIVGEFYADEDFFGAERIASIVGPNRYRDAIQKFASDAGSNLHTRRVMWDEMDVDVHYKVLNQADFKASATLRAQARAAYLESLRHHPELMKRSIAKIDWDAFLMRGMADMGEDIEAITRSPEESQRIQEEEKAAQQQALQQQAQLLQITESAKAQGKVQVEQAKGQVKVQSDTTIAGAKHEATLEEIMAKVSAEQRLMLETALVENRNQIAQMNLAHEQSMARMREEFAMELIAQREGTRVSVGAGSNRINQPSN